MVIPVSPVTDLRNSGVRGVFPEEQWVISGKHARIVCCIDFLTCINLNAQLPLPNVRLLFCVLCNSAGMSSLKLFT